MSRKVKSIVVVVVVVVVVDSLSGRFLLIERLVEWILLADVITLLAEAGRWDTRYQVAIQVIYYVALLFSSDLIHVLG